MGKINIVVLKMISFMFIVLCTYLCLELFIKCDNDIISLCIRCLFAVSYFGKDLTTF